jgi:chemotaxis protein CheC
MNLGVGHAAGAFSRLINDEVLLSVPDVSFVALNEAEKVFSAAVPAILAGVKQSFSGFIGGSAALLFPEDRSLELVRAIIGEDLPAEEISELEQETLAEVGNIILNNCLATIANVLQDEIQTSLPETYAGGTRGFLDFLCAGTIVSVGEDGAEGEVPLLMLVQIDFSLKRRAIQGFLAFAIDLRSAASFRRRINAYLDALA